MFLCLMEEHSARSDQDGSCLDVPRLTLSTAQLTARPLLLHRNRCFSFSLYPLGEAMPLCPSACRSKAHHLVPKSPLP